MCAFVCVYACACASSVLMCTLVRVYVDAWKRDKERKGETCVYSVCVFRPIHFFFKRCQVGPYRVLQFDPIGEYNPLCRVFNITPCEGFYLEPSINGSTSPISL